MEEGYRIAQVDDPDDLALTAVGHGIMRYNEEQAGADGHKRLYIFLYSPDGTVVGGLTGATFWDWFYINLLWVTEGLRGHGYGHRLLMQAEQHAKERGARNAYLDTFSFQAPRFYERHGYEVFGELEDFPKGHRRYFLRKRL